LTKKALGAALAASLLLAACGSTSHSTPIPHGSPTLRHPASDIQAAQTAEEMRAQLVVASSLYSAGRRADAQSHMNVAQTGYTTLTGPVSRHDPVLDREINAAFGVIAGQIAAKEVPLQVTNRMGLMQGQLLDAAIADSVDLAARNDPTVAAQVLLNVSAQGAAAYAAAARQSAGPRRTRDFQNAFGLLTRALALSRNLSTSLGPERRATINAIGAAHNDGFPLGVLVPAQLQPLKVAVDVKRMQAAVAKRFGLV
jgi:hypothetical protein